jgi:hypothetical protein
MRLQGRWLAAISLCFGITLPATAAETPSPKPTLMVLKAPTGATNIPRPGSTPTPGLPISARATQQVEVAVVDFEFVVTCPSVNVIVTALDSPGTPKWTKTYTSALAFGNSYTQTATGPRLTPVSDLKDHVISGCLGTIAVPVGSMQFTLGTPRLNTEGLSATPRARTIAIAKASSPTIVALAYCNLESISDYQPQYPASDELYGLWKQACR